MMYVSYQFPQGGVFHVYDYTNFIIFFPSYENVSGQRYDLINIQIRILKFLNYTTVLF